MTPNCTTDHKAPIQMPYRDLLCLFAAGIGIYVGTTVIAVAQTLPLPAARVIHVGQLASKTNSLTSARAGEYSAGKVVALTEQMVAREDFLAMVGNFGTQSLLTLAAEGILEKQLLASIAPMTGLRSALNGPNIFQLHASYEDEVLAMFNHAKSVRHLNVVYLFFEAGVGTQLANRAPEMASQSRINLLRLAGFEVTADKALQESAVTGVLNTFGTDGPDVVVLIAVGGVHSEAVKALSKHFGSSMPIYSLGQISSGTLIKDVGPKAVAGVMLTQAVPEPATAMLPVMPEFHADLRKLLDSKAPGYKVFEGYLAGRVTAEVVKRSTALTCDAILKSAQNVVEIDLGGYRVVYNPNQRKSLHPVELTMITQTGRLIR